MRGRVAIGIAWLATLWLAEALLISVVEYTRGLDVVALAIALPAQLAVAIAWSLFPRFPLWVVAGHGLIMLSLGVGFLITGPVGAPLTSPFGVPLPWLIVGLVPTGAAMIIAAVIHWERSEGPAH